MLTEKVVVCVTVCFTPVMFYPDSSGCYRGRKHPIISTRWTSFRSNGKCKMLWISWLFNFDRKVRPMVTDRRFYGLLSEQDFNFLQLKMTRVSMSKRSATQFQLSLAFPVCFC